MTKTTLAIAATTIALALAVAAPLGASAHVALDDDTAEPGGNALLTFTVPNESETAGTDRVAIGLPADANFSRVSYVPTPGWSAEVTDDAVTFTAEPGSAITAGQLQLFTVSVGSVPDVDSLAFSVEQGYDDGTVVEWNGDDDRPAPILYVNAEPVADHHAQGEETEPAHDVDEADSPSPSDVLARVFGIAGLVIGVVALVIAVTVRRRTAP